ncbi:MAG: hypothetical protein JNG83_13320 [Opitutaceae bacterium]|nr:hypothetical protein [Opitutaceae bacterium]
MRDTRFIELVNLYIDRQISSAEAAELEAEIQANPRRRAVYLQYCRMHRATKLVYESFRSHAPEQQPATTPAAEGSIARFEVQRRQRRGRWGYYLGTAAAAACVAIALARINAPDTTATRLMATLTPAPVPTAVAAPQAREVAPVQVAAADVPVAPATTLRTTVAAETDYSALLATLREEESQAFASGRIQLAKAPSLFDDAVFDSGRYAPAGNQRVFRSRQSPAVQAEFTAFQFQR